MIFERVWPLLVVLVFSMSAQGCKEESVQEAARETKEKVDVAAYFDNTLPIEYIYCKRPYQYDKEDREWRFREGGQSCRIVFLPGEERYCALLEALESGGFVKHVRRRPWYDSIVKTWDDPGFLNPNVPRVGPDGGTSVLIQRQGDGKTVQMFVYEGRTVSGFIAVEDTQGNVIICKARVDLFAMLCMARPPNANEEEAKTVTLMRGKP